MTVSGDTAPPVFGIVGWKNSGKTTLVAALIAEFAGRGLHVAAIKHAHHAFDIDQPGRDSHRFREAGARTVAIASDVRWAVIHEVGDGAPPTFHDMLARVGPCDLVLVEGFKGGPFPKVEARSARTATREALADDDSRIVAIAADCETDTGGLPRLDLNDAAAIADFIAHHIGLHVPAI